MAEADSQFSVEALDAGVSAWFGVTKVEAERNFIRDRMQAAVDAVLEHKAAAQEAHHRFTVGDVVDDASFASMARRVRMPPHQQHPSLTSALARLSRALGSTGTVEAFEGETIEAALVRMAVERLTDRPAGREELLAELYRALCAVGVVGQIEGHDVIRRLSLLDVVRSRQMRKEVQA